MLTDPEEGHYSNENKAGKAFRRALFTLDRARRYSHLLQADTQRRLFKLVHTIEARDHSGSLSPRAATPDMEVTSGDAAFIAPVTAA